MLARDACLVNREVIFAGVFMSPIDDKTPPDALERDGLGIPPFLRVTKEQAATRKAWNDAHPISVATMSGATEERRREVDEARAKFDAEMKAAETKRLNELHARKKREAADETKGGFVAALPGTVWNPQRGRFVDPHYMSKARYERLLAEMPDDVHRAAFIKKFGAGQGASPGVDVTRDASESGKPAAAGPPTPRSGTKPAGRGSTPRTLPTGGEGSEAARPRRVVAGPVSKKRLGKEEQVAKVGALLLRPEGATLAEIGAEFGWQEHSTSAFISVNFRNLGRATTKEKVEGRGTVYRIAKKK